MTLRKGSTYRNAALISAVAPLGWTCGIRQSLSGGLPSPRRHREHHQAQMPQEPAEKRGVV